MNSESTAVSESNSDYHTPTNDQVARKAYELWERAGRPENSALNHWLAAEKSLLSPTSVKEELHPTIPPVSQPPRPTEDSLSSEAITITGNRGSRVAPDRGAATRVRKP